MDQQGLDSELEGSRGEEPEGDATSPRAGGFLDCDETVERLYFYLDGELTEERRAEIQRHLDLCGPCVRAFGFETELRKVIADRCKDHVPQHLIERIAVAIHEEQQRQTN